MAMHQGQEAWESANDGLRLRRSVEPQEDDEFLVELRFENTTDGEIVGRVIEDLPPPVSSATLVTAPGGDPGAWRHFDEWIVHEPRIPGNVERTVAYVLETDGRSWLRLPPPRVRAVKHTETPSVSDADGGTTKAATVDPAAMAVTADAGAVTSSSPSRSPSLDSNDRKALVEQLLDALEDDQLEDRRHEVKAKLGLAPSERARIEYVQSRLDDLAAYVDALEALVDEHGTDVIAELRETVRENEERTRSVKDTLDAMADDVDRYRADADHEIASIRSYLTDLDVEIADRLAALEKKTDRLDRSLDSARENRRANRHALARDVRRVDQSMTTLSETVTELEADVEEFEAFRERITTVCSSGPQAPSRD